MKFRFPIVIIDEDYRSENTSGLGIRALAQAIESEGRLLITQGPHKGHRVGFDEVVWLPPLAPVPQAQVSPEPRSQVRCRTSFGESTSMNSTFTRAGNAGWFSICGPIPNTHSSVAFST